MGERNYIVYTPTPLGTGIIVAVFVSEYAAKQFIARIAGDYAVAEVEVNGSTSIRRYMDMVRNNINNL